jgi:integrase/recombinase XerC
MKLTELNELIKEFIDFKQLKANSARAYKNDLHYFAQFYADKKFTFEELNRQTIISWLQQFPQRAANRRGTNVRKFLLWMEDAKKIKINNEIHLPWQFTDPTPKKPDRPAFLADEEFQELISSRDLSLYKKALLSLLLTTGAGLEEIATLKWKDITLGKLAHAEIGESGKTRLVPLENEVAELLKSLKRKTQNLNEQDEVFRSERAAELVNGAYLAMVVRRATDKVLAKDISPTQLHEYAKKRLFEKTNIKVAMELLGKKKATSLMRMDSDNIDLNRLKKIHEQVFAAN